MSVSGGTVSLLSVKDPGPLTPTIWCIPSHFTGCGRPGRRARIRTEYSKSAVLIKVNFDWPTPLGTTCPESFPTAPTWLVMKPCRKPLAIWSENIAWMEDQSSCARSRFRERASTASIVVSCLFAPSR